MTPHSIIDALEKQGVTRYRISSDIRISKTTLTNWYTGKTKPDPDKFEKLLKYYELVVNNA